MKLDPLPTRILGAADWSMAIAWMEGADWSIVIAWKEGADWLRVIA